MQVKKSWNNEVCAMFNCSIPRGLIENLRLAKNSSKTLGKRPFFYIVNEG